MASSCSPVWEKATSPVFTLKPDNSVPLFVSLAFFKLLLQHCTSKQVSMSASKLLHGIFKRNTRTLAALCLTQLQYPHLPSWLVFSSSYGDFSSQHWNPWLRTWCGAGTPAPQGGLLQLISHLICNDHTWEQWVPCICPSYQSGLGFFYISLGLGLGSASLQGIFNDSCPILQL